MKSYKRRFLTKTIGDYILLVWGMAVSLYLPCKLHRTDPCLENILVRCRCEPIVDYFKNRCICLNPVLNEFSVTWTVSDGSELRVLYIDIRLVVGEKLIIVDKNCMYVECGKHICGWRYRP